MICEAIFVPFMLADPEVTRGHLSAFFFPFLGTTLLWFLNGVAESLDNPFRKEASTLEVGEVQIKLNIQLRELVRKANAPTPSLRSQWRERTRRQSAEPETMREVRRTYTMRASKMREIYLCDA